VKNNEGMSILEYAILISVLLLALLATQDYLRRAISYRWRDCVDAFGGGAQYAPQGAKATLVVNY